MCHFVQHSLTQICLYTTLARIVSLIYVSVKVCVLDIYIYGLYFILAQCDILLIIPTNGSSINYSSEYFSSRNVVLFENSCEF